MGTTGFGGEKESTENQFQDLSSILVSPYALNNQQNLSSEEEVDNSQNILEEVENEDTEDREF